MAAVERSKDPIDVLEEAEQQWIYTEEELLRAPSIVAGMSAQEERLLRSKCINFITQVGIMLKLPQTTLSTAAVFCNRYLMRCSLVKKPGYTPLHHYQIAAIAIFIATKVEEHTRKLKELVISCVRVALKDPNKLVDEQTKDFWKWRDTIINNEDQLLEMLCFDLNLESPYRLLYDLLKGMNVHHNKKLRDAAWAFINDTNMTQACLLFTSRTIAATALHFAARKVGVELPVADDGRPWYRANRVPLVDISRAINYMADFYENTQVANGQNGNPYSDMRTPLVGDDDEGSPKASVGLSPLRTPIARSEGEASPSPDERFKSNWKKREREDEAEAFTNGDSKQTNGHAARPVSRVPQQSRTVERSPKRRKANESGSEEGEI